MSVTGISRAFHGRSPLAVQRTHKHGGRCRSRRQSTSMTPAANSLTSSSKTANGQQAVLTINAGSSSIKFALFDTRDSLTRTLKGWVERIGFPDTMLKVNGTGTAETLAHP